MIRSFSYASTAALRARGGQGARHFCRLKSRRQVVTVDHAAVADQCGPLDAVLELPHVAGPVVADQHVDHSRGEAPHVLAVRRPVLLHEVVGQQGDVGLPVPQRRQVDAEHVEAVVEVLTKRPGGDGGVEVLVSHGDDSDVHFDGAGAAEALELTLLEHAQQLDLGRRAELADLVQEEGAAVGQLEAALLARPGVGEGAGFVAEQLGLDERLGQRAAAHLDEGFVGARETRSGWRGPRAPCRCPILHGSGPWSSRGPPAPPARRRAASAGCCR